MSLDLTHPHFVGAGAKGENHPCSCSLALETPLALFQHPTRSAERATQHDRAFPCVEDRPHDALRNIELRNSIHPDFFRHPIPPTSQYGRADENGSRTKLERNPTSFHNETMVGGPL
jgi:hypothetical protein